jgi:hypothetical protein
MPPTWVLLQVWLDVVIFGCSSLSAVVSADEILLGFWLLSCTFKSLLGSGSGLDCYGKNKFNFSFF